MRTDPTGQMARGRQARLDVFAVEWHRPEPRRRLYRAWGIGSALVVLGALLGVTVLSLEAPSTAVRVVLTACGLLASGAGPVVVLVAAFRVLADDTCLVLRNDGVSYNAEGNAFFVAWADLVSVEYDERADVLTFRTEDGAHIITHPRFADTDAAELVKRIHGVRRRALMRILEP